MEHATKTKNADVEANKAAPIPNAGNKQALYRTTQRSSNTTTPTRSVPFGRLSLPRLHRPVFAEPYINSVGNGVRFSTPSAVTR